jgi:hypothetical protein
MVNTIAPATIEIGGPIRSDTFLRNNLASINTIKKNVSPADTTAVIIEISKARDLAARSSKSFINPGPDVSRHITS